MLSAGQGPDGSLAVSPENGLRPNVESKGAEQVRSLSKSAVIGAIVGAGALGGLIGAALFGPGPAIAQTPTPTATSSTGTFHSNEDKTHEAGESAAREAAENSGTFRGGRHGGGSNEDAAHEAGESAAREAEENANQSPNQPSTGGTPSTAG